VAKEMKKKKKNLPTKYKIAEHWATKKKKPSWLSIDIGEPTCWGCGEIWGGDYDVSKKTTPKEAWQKAPLERCHIVPEALGGSSDPSNLFLMCKSCHESSPDTTDPKEFFEWCHHISSTPMGLSDYYESLVLASKMCKVTVEEMAKTISKGFHLRGSREILSKVYDTAGTHGFGYSKGTRAVMMKKIYNEFAKSS